MVEDPWVGQPAVLQAVPSFWAPEVEWPPPPYAPRWYNPLSWIHRELWDGSLELGVNAAEGNTNNFNLVGGFDLTRQTIHTTWDIDFTYTKAEADGVETQHNALLYSDWDRKLNRPKWSWSAKSGLEYDEFTDFDMRFFANTGLGYLLFDDEFTRLRGRFGAGTSREIRGTNDNWEPEASLGTNLTRRLSKWHQLRVIADIYPSWLDFSNYRVVTDASWEIALTTDNDLSLKLTLIDRYDSTPEGASHNDVNYAILLLWDL